MNDMSPIVNKRPARRRVPMATTLHPDTVDRLEEMANQYHVARGQLIDKLVLSLYVAVKGGHMVCIHGEQCRMGRTDVPAVL